MKVPTHRVQVVLNSQFGFEMDLEHRIVESGVDSNGVKILIKPPKHTNYMGIDFDTATVLADKVIKLLEAYDLSVLKTIDNDNILLTVNSKVSPKEQVIYEITDRFYFKTVVRIQADINYYDEVYDAMMRSVKSHKTKDLSEYIQKLSSKLKAEGVDDFIILKGKIPSGVRVFKLSVEPVKYGPDPKDNEDD